MNPIHFLILGTESRQLYLRKLLAQKGYRVTASEEWEPGEYQCILLPVPKTGKYLSAILSQLKEGHIVFGCNFPEKLQEQGERQGARFVDYMKAEGVASRNAIATAEGAIVEALLCGTRSIHGSNSIVFGYGRCGEILAAKLCAMESRVTVVDRKSGQRARAIAHGCEAVDFQGDRLAEALSQADFVFNTVPAPVVSRELLQKTNEEVVIIDIASRPGGVDFEYCQQRGLHAKLSLGLPGKYAPKSAAGVLLEVIENII